MSKYYKILDKNLIGRQDGMFDCYIYDEISKEWKHDNENILMDRIMGYDGDSIGNSAELFKIEEITQKQVEELIDSL